VRVPLIPEITDTAENIRGICDFMQRVGLRRIALLPYNASAGAKYEWLDLAYQVAGEPQSPEKLQALRAIAQAFGLEAVVV
jgi:pyruvate-formate lyase-activating enzyme